MIPADCHGMDFYKSDPAFQILLEHYMAPHLDRLGALAGGRLAELARIADLHAPVLHPRDSFGRDEDWIEYHPSYRATEKIAFDEFGPHEMRAGPLSMAVRFSPSTSRMLSVLSAASTKPASGSGPG